MVGALQDESKTKKPTIKDIPNVRLKSTPKLKLSAEVRQHQERRRKLLLLWYGLVFLALVSLYVTSEQNARQQRISKAMAQYQSIEQVIVDESDRAAVEQSIRRLFIGGSWRYQGSKLLNNKVHVFIQIPKQLSDENELQHQYIKGSLCPKSNDPVWQRVRPHQVKLHLYVWDKGSSVSADCV